VRRGKTEKKEERNGGYNSQAEDLKTSQSKKTKWKRRWSLSKTSGLAIPWEWNFLGLEKKRSMEGKK